MYIYRRYCNWYLWTVSMYTEDNLANSMSPIQKSYLVYCTCTYTRRSGKLQTFCNCNICYGHNIWSWAGVFILQEKVNFSSYSNFFEKINTHIYVLYIYHYYGSIWKLHRYLYSNKNMFWETLVLHLLSGKSSKGIV